MIDPVQIPILLKAIDFVFEEGHKILEERRERRKSNDTSVKREAQESVQAPNLPGPEPEKIMEIKQDLVTSKIDELLWKNHEAEVQHLVRLLEIYSSNYHIAKEQYAKWGSALVPPIIVNNMTEAENSIIETSNQLQAILAKIYNKDIPTIK